MNKYILSVVLGAEKLQRQGTTLILTRHSFPELLCGKIWGSITGNKPFCTLMPQNSCLIMSTEAAGAAGQELLKKDLALGLGALVAVPGTLYLMKRKRDQKSKSR